jgi:Thioesterase-like superfamily
MRWAPSIGTRFTIDSLPYLADSFRPLPEAYGLVGNWYATLSYGVEVKRAPDEEEGWEWLFMRVEMGEVRNGRFGMEVWIFDEEERLVARSWHTALILGTPSERKVIERAVEGAKI